MGLFSSRRSKPAKMKCPTCGKMSAFRVQEIYPSKKVTHFTACGHQRTWKLGGGSILNPSIDRGRAHRTSRRR